MEIFCPNNHLILDAQSCEKCGWQRPVGGTVGKPIWGPVDLLAGLGGESRENFGTITCSGNTLLLPLRSNELVGVSLINGQVKWRSVIPVGKKLVGLNNEDERVYVVLQDTHSLMEGVEPGSINILDQKTGKYSLYWQAPSHDLTPPLFWKDRFIVRTAESKVYARLSKNPEQVLWEYPLNTWWAAPLFMNNGQLILVDGNAMFGEGSLLSLNAADGTPQWLTALPGMPSKQIVADQEHIYCVHAKKQVQAYSVQTGEVLWEKSFARIYSSPCVCKDQVVLAVRGAQDSKSDNYYSLVALSNITGEVRWQVGFKARVRIQAGCVEDTLLVADDNGYLSALAASDGRKLWTLQLGHEEDPLHTNLFVKDNLVVVGTYFGNLSAITYREEARALEDPEVHLQAGEWKLAADIYALQSDFGKAASIYETKLNEIDRAIQLYEKGQDFKSAARLAMAFKTYSSALQNYRKAGDSVGEANTLIKMGDLEGAAQIFESLGDLKQAAALMEEAGNLKQAAGLFQRAGVMREYLRLVTKTLLDVSEVEKLRSSGNYEVAARWELANQKYLEASKDFRKIGKEHEELDALKAYLANNKAQAEPWVWQRVAELGEGLGDYVSAANAWLMLDRPEDAGAVYLILAEDLVSRNKQPLDSIPMDVKIEIATRYRQAADAFKEAGLSEKEEKCRHEVRRYRQLPKVVILQVESKSGFREMEWNQLNITVQNIGYGRAIDVTFEIGAARFELLEASRTFSFNLSSEIAKQQLIHLRPLKDQYGECVPLEIHWQWKDNKSNLYQDSGSVPVRVVPQRDPQSAVPIIYQFQNVENLVQGDQIKGDRVDQKGDRVTINRNPGSSTSGARIDVQSSDGDRLQIPARRGNRQGAAVLSKVCPNCGKTNSPQAKHCVFCRTPFDDGGCTDNDKEA